MSGLLGFKPDTCQPNIFEQFEENSRPFELDIDGKAITYHPGDIIFDAVKHDYPHSNTMIFRLLDSDGKIMLERIYFSVGGGFLRWVGWEEPQRGEPVYPYETMAELKNTSLIIPCGCMNWYLPTNRQLPV